MTDLKAFMSAAIGRVNGALDEFLPPENARPETLSRAMRYSVFNGGKRVRPILAILACRACGGDEATVMPAACSLEMIHSYSLIHDDLPALDNDDLRRGKPSCHKAFGEDIAILAGDGLLTYAFYNVAERMVGNPAAIRIVRDLGYYAGVQGMVGGQVVDVISENEGGDEDTLKYIHENKTAALLMTALRIGGLAAECDDSRLSKLTEYGMDIGLAFQIADDILDVEGDKETLGKSIGKDAASGKLTYPGLLGMERAKKAASEHAERAVQVMQSFPHSGPEGAESCALLVELAKFIVNRNS